MNRQLLILGVLNVAVLVAGLVLTRSSERAESDYPQRPIELVVPFSHGGGTDTFARIIEYAIRENQLLPQPLTVINRGGAGATIGSRYVKDAEPDGYTLMVLHDALITARVSGMVDYGPEAFVPVAGTGELGMVIAVAEDSPFETLEDLLAAARDQPETIRFGANLGALTHFAGLQLEKESPGARFLFPQVGGGADRFSDLLGGHIDVTGFSIEEFHRFATGGLRGLAYLGQQRHPSVPDLPTAIELGYDIVNTNMFFWWFPKGTPPECVEVMRETLRSAMQTDYVRSKLEEIQCEPVFLTGDALQERLATAEQRFSHVAARPRPVLGDLPWMLAAATGVLALLAGLQAWWAYATGKDEDPTVLNDDDDEDATSAEYKRAFGCLGLTALYIAALMSGIGFVLSTLLFVVSVGSLLMPGARGRQTLLLLLIAQVLGFGLKAMFTMLFDVSLP